MSRREDLRHQLAELETQLLALRTLADKQKPTAEDLKKVTSVCDDIERVQKELELEDRADKAIAGIRKPVEEPAPQGQPSAGEERKFASFGEYLQAVAATASPRGGRRGKFASGVYDKRLTWQDEELRATGMEEGVPSLGGFLVTTDFSTQLIEGFQAKSVLYPKTRKITLSSNANGVKVPGIDEASRASTRWGGIVAYWESEGGTITATKPKFRNVELALNKLTGLVYVTDEMLEDSSVLESVVREGFMQEFAFKVDDAILNGTGSGQPLGILNGPSLVSITGYTATTIAAQDVTAQYARLIPSSHPKAEWFANVDTLPTMLRMSLGNNNYAPLWMPDQQLFNAPRFTLMGKPVNFVEQCATVGTVGDLLLLDLSQYITITKGGLKAAASIHVQFVTDETAFRFILRIDGQPAWHSALTPYKGSNTLSPFVAIATRS